MNFTMLDHERPEPPQTGDEQATLAGFLNWQRATLAWKCTGLMDEQLRERSVPPSTMSLLGLIRHITDVEQAWFSHVLDGRPFAPVYWAPREATGEKTGTDTDWDVEGADVAAAVALWEAECTKSREISASKDLDTTGFRARNPQEKFSHRWILTHMIEEYARHNGHADLLRELIDGTTGE